MKVNLDSYISGLKNLPTPPGVLIKLIKLFQQPDRDIDEVAALIRQDPSLTAEVLRQANSAYMTPEQPIGDIFDAIARVGFADVYRAIIAKLASQALILPKGAEHIDVGQLWRHSAAAGVCSAAIAKRVQQNESLAFTAGLLHDVGKVVLSLSEGEVYGKLIKRVGPNGKLLQEAETMLFGFGHADAGASLLTIWGLPEEISEAVRQHHHLTNPLSANPFNAAVTLGNIMAHASAAHVIDNFYQTQEAIGAMESVGLTEFELTRMARHTEKEIRQLTGSLAA